MGNRERTEGFEQFEVWQKAIDMAVAVYKLTDTFPKSEIYSLTNQMRRASSSVSANIAEGYGRHGFKEKLQFYKIASGSLLETKSFCYLSNRLGYVSEKQLDDITISITALQKMINALIRSVKSSNE